MTPELKLAQFLSSDESKQKLASKMEDLSVDELEGVLKEANGDMLQYFQDHPEKLKEKQERDAKKEKKAATVGQALAVGAGASAVSGAAGYALGKHHGRKEKKSSSKTEDNESRETDAKNEIENEEKLSPQDKLKKADAFGRELAKKEKEAAEKKDHTLRNTALAVGGLSAATIAGMKAAGSHPNKWEKLRRTQASAKGIATNLLNKAKHAEAEKTAVIAFGAGKALGAIGGAAKAVGNAAKAVPKAVKGAPGAAKGVGSFLKKDWQATKQQFSAGVKGQARPALAKTPLSPVVHHNAAPPAPAAAAAAPAKKGLSSGAKAGLIAAGGATAGMVGHAALDKRKEQQQKAASVEKIAVINFAKAGKTVGELAKKVGKGAHGAVSSAATHLGNIKDPIGRGAAIGAATGGVGGAVQGFLDPKENPVTGEKQRLRTAFRKGLAGAAAGAPTGALFGAMSKAASVQKLEAALEKRALGMAGIGSMAKNFVGSMKPVAEKAMGAVKPMAQKAMGAAQNFAAARPKLQQGLLSAGGALHSAGQGIGANLATRAGVGAAAGGALGAAKGLVAPGRDAQGQQKSRLGAMARGAAGGAALGAGAGAVAPKALQAVGGAAFKAGGGHIF